MKKSKCDDIKFTEGNIFAIFNEAIGTITTSVKMQEKTLLDR